MVNRRQLLKLSALGTASFAAPTAYSMSEMTMSYNTNNPIGSTNPKDLFDNAKNFDSFSNGPGPTYKDRLGVDRKSIPGMIAEFDTDQTQRAANYAASEASRGYENPVPYAAGIAMTRVTQLIQYGSEFYKAKAGTLSWTTTGIWATDSAKLVSVGDAVLRQDLFNPAMGTNILSHQRSALVDAIGTANLMLSAQAVNIWEYRDFVTSKPTLDPNTWDWTAAHLAAITECKKLPNKRLEYPAGQYPTTAMLDFGSLAVTGAGTDANTGTEIRAATDGMLIAKCGSGCSISNIKFNGQNKALWNLMILGNRPVVEKVESVYAKEFGYVFGSTQNGSFYSLTSYSCLYSYGFYNGVRNCNFFGCGSATSSGPTGTRDPLQAELVFDYDTSNPHGFGLPTVITTNGNDRIAFFGGIYEYPDTIVRMKNTANTTKDVGRVFFYSAEMSGGGNILDTLGLTANSSPELFFDNCEFTWKDQTTPFSLGTIGKLTFQGFASFSGGAQLVNRGILLSNNLDTRGIKVEDGTVYIDAALNVTTVPKNGFSRPVATGSITEAVSFTTGQKESWFTEKTAGGAAFVAGTTYRQVKGSIPETLTYALTSGINQTGVYSPSGVNPFPLGVAHLVENLGNGATDAALLAFRVRNNGGNMYAYLGAAVDRFVIGVRNNTNYQERLSISSPAGHILPGADNTQNLGSATFRYATVFAGTGAINTSDGRAKQDVRSSTEAERAVAVKVKGLLRAFRFKDSVAAKGDSARIHFGVIAQEVGDAFASEGLDANDYALFCHDEWEDEYVDVCEEVAIVIDGAPLLDDSGNPCTEGQPTGQMRLVKKGGDRYGIRYDELLAFIIAAL